MITKTEHGEFHLHTKETSYLFRVLPTGHLEHLYYGRRVTTQTRNLALRSKLTHAYGTTVAYDTTPEFSLDVLPLEFSGFGKGDFRHPAIMMTQGNSLLTTDFRYISSEIVPKPSAGWLPLAQNAPTLVVTLQDAVIGAQLLLYYTVYEESDVITRRCALVNTGNSDLQVNSLYSVMVDFMPSDYCLTTLTGTWGQELNRHTQPVTAGTMTVESLTGLSSNRANPYICLHEPHCTEQSGVCYGVNLLYSGNFQAGVQVSPLGFVRLFHGLHPSTLPLTLATGERFDAPEAALSVSHSGFTGLSHHWHDFVNESVLPAHFRYAPRPVLLNSWEAQYFQVSEARAISLSQTAATLGIELFVVDDGWFGKRHDDTSSLGDWTVNHKKLPHGLSGLATRMKDMPLGIWVEPEMISTDSDLYRAHPTWVIQSLGRKPSFGRNQLVLDLTQQEVRTYMIDVLTTLLTEAPITYVKWDCNRPLTDVTAPQGFYHRYVLGLYEVLTVLTNRFPDVLWEGCASGGNRFDLGMLSFMPQIWLSDCTDARERLRMQSAATLAYPLSCFTAHVSDSPCHQTLRQIPLQDRFHVAAFGVLGYELDVTALTNEERKQVTAQVRFYQQYREVFQYGRFYRLSTNDKTIWQVVSENQSTSIVGFFVDRVTPQMPPDCIRMAGLKPDALYRVTAMRHPLPLRVFGSLIYRFVPKNIKIDGVAHKTLNRVMNLQTEAQQFVAYGDILMYAGFKPKQSSAGAGYDQQTRLLLDSSSRLYLVQEVTEET